jgi:hypothetical protein
MFGTPPFPETVIGIVLLSTAAVFSVVPVVLLGKIKPKDAGIIMFIFGIVTLSCGLYNLFILQLSSLPAALILPLIFGGTQLSFAYHFYRELEQTGNGWLSITFAITTAVVTLLFAKSGEWLYTAFGVLWTFMFISYIPLISPKLLQKTAKAITYYNWFCTFFALLLPGLLLLSGYSLLM